MRRRDSTTPPRQRQPVPCMRDSATRPKQRQPDTKRTLLVLLSSRRSSWFIAMLSVVSFSWCLASLTFVISLSSSAISARFFLTSCTPAAADVSTRVGTTQARGQRRRCVCGGGRHLLNFLKGVELLLQLPNAGLLLRHPGPFGVHRHRLVGQLLRRRRHAAVRLEPPPRDAPTHPAGARTFLILPGDCTIWLLSLLQSCLAPMICGTQPAAIRAI